MKFAHLLPVVCVAKSNLRQAEPSCWSLTVTNLNMHSAFLTNKFCRPLSSLSLLINVTDFFIYLQVVADL